MRLKKKKATYLMAKKEKLTEPKPIKVKKTTTAIKKTNGEVKKTTTAVKKKTKLDLLDAIIFGMQEKKAHNIVCLDMRSIKGSLADYFVICNGNSRTQTSAISKSIEEQVFKHTGEHGHVEGEQNAEWILLDYFDIIAHVFIEEKRDFYALEKLWGDAEIKKIANA